MIRLQNILQELSLIHVGIDNMKVTDRRDNRRKVKFNDMCTDNSCIIWVIAIFKGSLPAYIRRHTPKKWEAKLNDLYDYMDSDKVNEIIKEVDENKCSVIISEFQFNWVDNPAKYIDDQIFGMNISGWLTKNPNHKSLIYAESWNKID